MPTTTYTQECPFDYLPGLRFRWTVDGHQDMVGQNHPDDLVCCPECAGSGRVPMTAADFKEWGEAPPADLSEPAPN